MVDLKSRSGNEIFQLTSISVSNFKSNIPRVNFRKIKLNRFQSLYSNFKSKNITQLYPDEKFLEFNLPIRKTESAVTSNEISVNPLRKKKNDEEEENIIIEESVLEPESLENLGNLENLESKKDITFNLEAEIVHEDENMLLSPTFPATPQIKDDLVSSSGEGVSFVWPPVLEKKIKKKTKHKKIKKKPYFLSAESKPLKQSEEKSKKIESKISDTSNFPWALTQNDNPPIEEIFRGGLESELLDVPEKIEVKEQKEEKIKAPFTGEVVYKALFPNVSFESLPEHMINDSLKNIGWFSKSLDKFNNLEFGIVVTGKNEKKNEKRVGAMFEKFSYKLTPIRIIILGGAVATLGYSVWNYLLPIINSNQVSNKVIVRDLFKTKNIHANGKTLVEKNEDKLQMSELLDGKSFSPITEDERQSLIQMARESLENRLDPFGQEAVLPKEVIQQKLEEQMTGPLEIPVSRVQLELVGVISANN